MSFFGNLFKKHDSAAPLVLPPIDDSGLEEEISSVARRHAILAEEVAKSSKKQISDAQLIREVISGVLKRVDSRNEEAKKWKV